MKIKLNIPILTFEGKPIQEGEPPTKTTIKTLLITCLRFGGNVEDKDEEKKYKRFKLLFELQKLNEEDFLELKAEEIVDLKQLGNNIMPDPWIYGQFVNILEGK